MDMNQSAISSSLRFITGTLNPSDSTSSSLTVTGPWVRLTTKLCSVRMRKPTLSATSMRLVSTIKIALGVKVTPSSPRKFSGSPVGTDSGAATASPMGPSVKMRTLGMMRRSPRPALTDEPGARPMADRSSESAAMLIGSASPSSKRSNRPMATSKSMLKWYLTISAS